MGIRSRTLAVAAAGMGPILLAAGGGLYMSWRSLQTFELDVMARQRDAVAVIAAESDFKKQVQEWKDTLLRGFDPKVGDKAVTGIDRSPTELLTRAKDRIQAEAQKRADEAASAGRVAEGDLAVDVAGAGRGRHQRGHQQYRRG